MEAFSCLVRAAVTGAAVAWLSACSGGGGSAAAPFLVSGLTIDPSTAQRNSGGGKVTVTAGFSFSGAQGGVTSATVSILDASGSLQGSSVTQLQASASPTGSTRATVLAGTSVPGQYVVRVAVTDGTGAVANGAAPFSVLPDTAVGSQWTLRQAPSGMESAEFLSVAFRADASIGPFVAVGRSGAIATSPDGVVWTAAASPTSVDLNSVIWIQIGSYFIAVGAEQTILTSRDGQTWTQLAGNGVATDVLSAVASSGSSLVAVGSRVDAQTGVRYGITMTSIDGTTWTRVPDSRVQPMSSVTWCCGGAGFVASGQTVDYPAPTGGPAVLQSSNGGVWTVAAVDPHASSSATMGPVVPFDPVFALIPSESLAAWSSSGSAWTTGKSPAGLRALAMTGSTQGGLDSQGVGCGAGFCSQLLSSLNWTWGSNVPLPGGVKVNALAYVFDVLGGNRLVAVGSPGAILTSP